MKSKVFGRLIAYAITLLVTVQIGAAELYKLEHFGKVDTVAAAQETYTVAIKEITAKGGGTLHITDQTATAFNPYSAVQKKLSANSVTVIDTRGGKNRIVLPSLGYRIPDDPNGYGGVFLDRQINQDAINQDGANVNLRISNQVVKGLTSYFQPIKDYKLLPDGRMKVYPATMAGLNSGAVLKVMQGKGRIGSSGEFETPSSLQARVVDLGWDTAQRKGYIIFEKLSAAQKWGELTAMINKSTVSAAKIKDVIHCDGEIASTVRIEKKIYGQGDNFGVGMNYAYMGNIMSTGGDENGCAYTVDTWQLLNSFLGKVDSWNAEKSELIYSPDSTRVNTLGTSRPIINLNPKKWITSGHIKVMANNSSGDSAQGGYILGVNVDWSPAVIGRAIAIDIPEEYCGTSEKGFWKHNLAGRKVRRWWRISDYQKTGNGEHRIWVERTRWNVNSKATPTLINENNYFKELSYIIAPCALVADVSDGIPSENKHEIKGAPMRAGVNDKRLIRLVPTGDTGTSIDFAVGDPIEQAIGPDPRHVVGYRVRHREANPTIMPSASFLSQNNGAYPIYAGLLITGPHDKMQIPSHNKYRSGVNIAASSDTAIEITGPTSDAAISLRNYQDNPQKIVWYNSKIQTEMYANDNGDLQLKGGALNVSGGQVVGVSGISSTGKKSFNLRGIDLAVKQGANNLEVKFDQPEPDSAYAVVVTPSWLTIVAVTEKTNTGFKIIFGTPAPVKAKLDWVLVR